MGSEMCIRDRDEAPGTPYQSAMSQENESARAEEVDDFHSVNDEFIALSRMSYHQRRQHEIIPIQSSIIDNTPLIQQEFWIDGFSNDVYKTTVLDPILNAEVYPVEKEMRELTIEELR